MKNSSMKSLFMLFVVILLGGLLAGCSKDDDDDPVAQVEEVTEELELELISPEASQVIYTGDSLSFEASASGGKEPYEYTWEFGDAVEAGYDTKAPGEVVFEKEGKYPLVFRVTDSDGTVASLVCYVEVRKDNEIESVTILSPEDGKTITQGGYLSFEGAFTGGDAPCSCQWNFGGAADDCSGDKAKNVQFAKQGNFTVTFTVTDTSGDVLSDSIQIIVNENPYGQGSSTDPSLEINASSQKINVGESVDFSSTVTGGRPPFRYQWYFSRATPGSSTDENPQGITFNTSGSVTASCTLTDAVGKFARAQATIQVLPDTIPNVNIGSFPMASNGEVTIIAGQHINFSALVSWGNAPYSYLWTFGGAAPDSSAKDPQNVTFADMGTFTVQLTVTDSDGDVGSKSMTVNVLGDLYPTAVIDSPSDNITINSGQYVTFRGTATPGNGSLRYSWYFGGGAPNSSREDPGNVIFNTPGIFTVTFSATDSDGDVETDSVTVTVVGTNPVAVTITNPSNNVTIGQGDAVNFQSAVTGGTPGYTYSWDFDGDGTIDSDVQDPGEITYSNTGNYNATLTVVDSLGSINSDTVIIEVVQYEDITVSIDSPVTDSVVVSGESLLFEGSAVGGLEPYSFSWNFGEGAPDINQEDPGDVVFNRLGIFDITLTVTDSRGESAEASIQVTVKTGRIWVHVSSGIHHSVAISTDGTLWAWGANNHGQLGDGIGGDGTNDYDSAVPVQISDEPNWSSVACGGVHTVAIKNDGSLWTWGANGSGQLGNGVSGADEYENVPTRVGIDNDWETVASGSYHTLALKNDHSLWAWGDNIQGQLGIGSTTDRNIPTQVGTDLDWSSISCGGSHNLALKNNNSLWAWGVNNAGQIGNGTIYGIFASPLQITSDYNWIFITCGRTHSIAIRSDGTLWAWGDNNHGKLGDGTNEDKNEPVLIGTDTDWNTICAGEEHTLAKKTDGSLWAWGENFFGQLGDGTGGDLDSMNNSNVPVPLNVGNEWLTVNCGSDHSSAIKNDNSLWTWGRNQYGQLGDGTNEHRNSPNDI